MGTHDASATHAPEPATSAEPSPETLPLPSWQAALRTAVREPAELLRLLELSPHALGAPAKVSFPLLVPRRFVARMRKGDPADHTPRSSSLLRASRRIPSGSKVWPRKV